MAHPSLKEALEDFGALVDDYEGRQAERRARAIRAGDNSCQSYQASSEMVCIPCGLRYDVNDPDPPVCRRTGLPARSSGRR